MTIAKNSKNGFTLIEVMITVAIVAILAAVALPSYRQYIVRAARTQAQTELLQLVNVQEKIYLNSNNYAFNVTSAYTGNSTGGLGLSSGKVSDNRYTVTLVNTVASQTYTLVATPVAGSTQQNDGNLSVTESGVKLWGTEPWK
jgi:type IV pilus assembly protein PilE